MQPCVCVLHPPTLHINVSNEGAGNAGSRDLVPHIPSMVDV